MRHLLVKYISTGSIAPARLALPAAIGHGLLGSLSVLISGSGLSRTSVFRCSCDQEPVDLNTHQQRCLPLLRVTLTVSFDALDDGDVVDQ